MYHQNALVVRRAAGLASAKITIKLAMALRRSCAKQLAPCRNMPGKLDPCWTAASAPEGLRLPRALEMQDHSFGPHRDPANFYKAPVKRGASSIYSGTFHVHAVQIRKPAA